MRGDTKMAAAAGAKTQRTGNARNTRPLGSIRVGNPVEATTSVPKFPQLVAARGDLQVGATDGRNHCVAMLHIPEFILARSHTV
jgi:hypothetical protein